MDQGRGGNFTGQDCTLGCAAHHGMVKDDHHRTCHLWTATAQELPSTHEPGHKRGYLQKKKGLVVLDSIGTRLADGDTVQLLRFKRNCQRKVRQRYKTKAHVC